MSPGDLIPLALYLVQQLGIMLGVGAASVFLISYLTSLHDGVVEAGEARFARVVQHVLEIGLVCIVLSGALITALHAMAGQYEVISSPAYFFKWLLIGFVSLALVLRRAKPYASAVWEGLVGATWYALFILHIVAPIAFWTDLLFLYAAWVAGFMLLWVSLVKLITAKSPEVVVPAPVAARPSPAPVLKTVEKPAPPVVPKVQQPAPLPPPPPVPKPDPKPPMPPVAAAHPLPVVAHAELAAPHKTEPVPIKASVPVKPPPPHATAAPQKPQELVIAQSIPVPPLPKTEGLIKNIDESDAIPHVYVMPRTPEDVEKHLRSAELQFS